MDTIDKKLLSIVLGIGIIIVIIFTIFMSKKQKRNNYNSISNQIVANKLEEIQQVKKKKELITCNKQINYIYIIKMELNIMMKIKITTFV